MPSLAPRLRFPLQPLSRPARLWAAVLGAACAAALLLVATDARADDAEAQKPEAPYFFVASDDPSTDRLPLKSTEVEVRIAGVIADVTVTQRYRNEGQRAIEARYVFPGSTRAAVHAMQVRLGERLLVANIREKQRARIEYETAKKEGRTSALLEQHRPNVFEMNVANILPGDDVAVELHYTELLTPTDALYGFVFPSVVGPRYNSPRGAAVAEKWIATPYLRSGQTSNASFDLKLTLDMPVALREINSSSHEIEVTGDGTAHASVALKTGAAPDESAGLVARGHRLDGAGTRLRGGGPSDARRP